MGEGSGAEPAPATRYGRAPDVVFEVTGGEALLVHGQELLRLNKVGTVLWELADGSRTFDAMVDELQSCFPGEARDRLASDAAVFLAELVEGGQLIVGRGARG